MDIPLIILGSGCAHVSSGYWRAITDVVFGDVFGAGVTRAGGGLPVMKNVLASSGLRTEM